MEAAPFRKWDNDVEGKEYINHHHHHHHWLDSPMWALTFLRSFCQLKYPAIASSDFVTRVFSRVGLSAQPPAIPEGQCFLLADKSQF
jgi:hypothetical protein